MILESSVQIECPQYDKNYAKNQPCYSHGALLISGYTHILNHGFVTRITPRFLGKTGIVDVLSANRQ